MKQARRGEAVESRLRRRVEITPDGCWMWQGRRDPKGYGRVTVTTEDGVYRAGILAHRLSYETFVGPIPAGLVIDHLCRNRACINPEHMEPVTQQENIRRSPVTLQTVNASKTHCKHGHEFTPENTLLRSRRGGLTTERACLTCRRSYRQRSAS